MNYRASLRLGVGLVDDLTSAVVTAFRAYVVIHYRSAAVGANSHLGNDSLVVSPSLIPALLGNLVFRMCHIKQFFNIYLLFNKSFRPLKGVSPAVSPASGDDARCLSISGLHFPSGWTFMMGSPRQI